MNLLASLLPLLCLCILPDWRPDPTPTATPAPGPIPHTFTCPVPDCVAKESRLWRPDHLGIDLEAVIDTPVVAAAAGTIIRAGTWCPANPCMVAVVIRHAAGYESQYWHLGDVAVVPGDWVVPGQLIGYSGMTGLTNFPHLHFRLLRGGADVDPAGYLAGLTVIPAPAQTPKPKGGLSD